MLSLNIETSGNLTSVSISKSNKILNAENILSEKPNHCELLSYLIEELINKVSISLKDLSQIRVNIGPGNLSSLRVGISTANALSSFGNIPLYGISSFLLYASSYNKDFVNICTLFDLRNNMFALAKYKKSPDQLLLVEENLKIDIEDLRKVDIKDNVLVGTGVNKFKSLYSNKSSDVIFDSNFVIDSSSLAEIDLNTNSNHIIKDSILVPINSFSFLS